jgi:hypothetical protein
MRVLIPVNFHRGTYSPFVISRYTLPGIKFQRDTVVHLCTVCSESLHFVGLAISACMFTLLPRPSSSCTADSSAALRAIAPVQSLVYAWPCYAPLQPLLPLPFPAPNPSNAHLAFHHSLSCSMAHFPPRFPYAFLTALCPFWHICCLGAGFECLPLVRLPFWRYCWNCLMLYFPKCPKALQSVFLLHVTRAQSKNSSRARTDNRIKLVPKLCSLELGTFWAALLFCYPQRCWNHVIVILSAGTRHLGHALCQPRMSIPVQPYKM